MPNKRGFVDFNSDRDVPPLNGKVVFITGGTAGLGAASVLALAKHNPEHIYFSGRNAQAATSLISEVQKTTPAASLTFIEMDLSSLSSVKAASKKFIHDRLDILMCNAGISENPPALSEDGYEIHFATNHLGHAMLIRQMLPVLLKTANLPDADVRIVILSSRAWWIHEKGGLQSKLANLIYARELAKRFPNIITVSIHPGIVATGMLAGQKPSSKVFMTIENLLMGVSKVDEDEGALNQVWAAAGVKKDGLVNGGYYEPVGVLCDYKLNKTAKNEGLAKTLWEWTEEALDKIE
ncbi:hypothetical protein BKA65DRAFT_494982 [Rhexocercosporidium sp. MPI-PUGE-AT-0058]|nr:hypothetical protein BKA65DRAFT_494982 [Rhexocercosporidium sp. MPI-PUGE-AT-0058]